MSKLFNQPVTSQRQHYEQQYRISRSNLLAVVVFTAINLLLLVTNANVYFLFSAYIPQLIASTGMYMTGKFPPEYYLEDMVFLDSSVFVILLVIAFAVTLLYLLAWYKSKDRHSGWLVFALVIFGVDTLLMFDGFTLDSALDLLFHAWVIYYLVMGINAAKKLRYMPEEPIVLEPVQPADGENAESGTPLSNDTPILRMADTAVKSRVLLQNNVQGYDIIYRRVKRTNELVVNGKVYGEYTAVAELPHVISAVVDGHTIMVGLRNSRSYIIFDGTVIAQKMRWF